MIRISRSGRGRIFICEFRILHSLGILLTLKKLQGYSEAEEGLRIGRDKDRRIAELQTPTHAETTAST